jgi:hypothetical protein
MEPRVRFLIPFTLGRKRLTMAAPIPTGGSSEKLPYSTPRLTIHGNLQTITAAKGGTRSDGGEPKTFNVANK